MPEFDRRDFLKLVGTSAGAAASVGCSDHVTNLIPYVVQPEEITPGIPVYYASTCRECPAGCGVHVKTRESRPILIEGNPEHPVNRGALCARGQASIGRTYHPGRFKGPMLRNAEGELEAISWEDAIARLAAEIGKNPRSAHFLGGHPGDTLSALMDRIVEGMGASRTVFETFAHEALSAASEQVFGAEAVPVFDLTDADLVIDFGSEVLDTGLSPTEHQRQLADARDTDKHPGGGARLVYVGSRLSLTASSADEWLPAVPGSEGLLALALAKVALGAGGDASLASAVGSVDVRQAAEASGIPADAIERIGRAIAKGTRVVALPPGPAVKSRRAIGATAAVLVLNAVAGAVGTGMTLAATTDKNRPNSTGFPRRRVSSRPSTKWALSFRPRVRRTTPAHTRT
jgi:anaerobic selenocysteine-containing dehydrogenase